MPDDAGNIKGAFYSLTPERWAAIFGGQVDEPEEDES